MSTRSYFLRLGDLSEVDRIILLQGERILCHGDNFLWRRDQLLGLNLPDAELHLLDAGKASYFAMQIEEESGESLDAEPHSLRGLLLSRGEEILALAGKANQILNWYHHHRYCGICGVPTVPHRHERAVYCANCDKHFHPRINPCVIVLVTRGREVLLARNAAYKGSFYSCLAGFIEVGETAEETVHREIREEVNIEVENIRYVKSQSWPFPSQLMLGFFADYRSGEVEPDGIEIEDAKWFDLAELPTHPSAGISVAGQLIELYRKLHK